MSTDVDAVVVGAGHNGLVAAAYLARAGVSTLLVEARQQVGGCASTVPALGARVNICNCDHLAVRSLPLIDELDLAAHGLRYLDLDPAQVCLSWSGDRPAVLFHDVDRTLDSLAVSQPDQVAGYRRYLRAALPVARLVLDLAASSPTPGHVARRLAHRRARGASTLLQWSRRSAAAVLRSYLSSETLLGAAIATGPAVWGVSPHQPGTGLAALRLAMAHAVWPGRPIGGSGALTDAVRASFESAGGRVRCGRTVAAVLVERGGVVGVRLRPAAVEPAAGSTPRPALAATAPADDPSRHSRDGDDGEEDVRASCVVVACDPRLALLRWLGCPPPPAMAAVVERWRRRPQFDGYESKVDAIIDVAPSYPELDGSLLDAVGVPEPLVPTTIVAPTVDGIAAAHRVAAQGRVARQPIFLVNVPSVADPSLRPPGGGDVFSLEALFTPYALVGGWVGSGEPRRWLEEFATRAGPGFLDGIRAMRAMTPDVYEREFGLARGYAPSFAGGPVAALIGRHPELSRYRTPLAGLYLTGAATFPGAGVWGAAGRNAAGVVLADLAGRPGRR